jgi:hypothetical protein
MTISCASNSRMCLAQAQSGWMGSCLVVRITDLMSPSVIRLDGWAGDGLHDHLDTEVPERPG